MDGASLVTSIEFDEVKRGYDPQQVDNYLEQVAQRIVLLQENLRGAIERAEAADSRVNEALRAKTSAEKALEDARADASAARESDDDAEALKKVLMLAQRTADAAVEEAQASAKNVVADARTKAAEVVADAEKRSERLLIEAQKVADDMMQERSAAIVREVADLQRSRDDLLSDIDELTSFLDDHRNRASEALKALQVLVSEPGLLKVADRPVLRSEGEPPSALAEPDQAGPDEHPRAAGAPLSSPQAPAVPTPVAPARPPAPAATPTAQPAAPAAAPAPSAGSPVAEASSAGSTITAEREAQPRNVLIEEPELVEAKPVLFDLELDETGPATQELSAVESEALFADDGEGDPLGQPDQRADEAMRKFFEEDFENNEKKGLFRRKP